MWIKTKRSACILIAVFALSVLVYILHDGEVAPVIHTIVIATKTKIHDATVEGDDVTTANLQKYLDMLGFGIGKTSYGRGSGKQHQSLAIATAALSRYLEHTFQLVKAFGVAFPNASIVLYNLDLWHNEASKLESFCNSTGHCSLRPFDLSSFPSHVRDLTSRAYKPILVQTLLLEFCNVIWIDCSSPLLVPTNRFVSLVNELTCIYSNGKSDPASRRKRDIDAREGRVRRQVKPVAKEMSAGLVGWSISLPTSALTQTGTFERLGEQAEHFYFSRMLSTSHLLFYRRDCCGGVTTIRNDDSEALRQSMLDWCRCVLDIRCLSPTGSQSRQCNLARVPSFKFSGCHLFEMSALNVALGTQYRYDATPYSLDARLSIFDAFNSTTLLRSLSRGDLSIGVSEGSMETQIARDDVVEEADSSMSLALKTDDPPQKVKTRTGFTLPFFDVYSDEIRWFGENQAELHDELA